MARAHRDLRPRPGRPHPPHRVGADRPDERSGPHRRRDRAHRGQGRRASRCTAARSARTGTRTSTCPHRSGHSCATRRAVSVLADLPFAVIEDRDAARATVGSCRSGSPSRSTSSLPALSRRCRPHAGVADLRSRSSAPLRVARALSHLLAEPSPRPRSPEALHRGAGPTAPDVSCSAPSRVRHRRRQLDRASPLAGAYPPTRTRNRWPMTSTLDVS